MKFNDLFLNYTITSDLSQCAPPSAQEQSGASFTVRIQVENPSSLEQISVESYEASVVAALGNVTANVTVAPRSAVQLSPDFQGSWAALPLFWGKVQTNAVTVQFMITLTIPQGPHMRLSFGPR